MGIQLARTIVDRLGGGRVLCLGAPDETLARELRLAGCEAIQVTGETAPMTADTLVVALTVADAHLLPLIIARYPTRNLVLRAGGLDPRGVETLLFEAGWRRHPAGMLMHDYVGLRDHSLPAMTFYQKIPEAAAARWTVADLMADRPLHMDMLRESGGRADAHIVRYALAATYIRPGDRVLDCACGLGYGTAVLAALSRGASFLGVDLDPLTAEYAQENYGLPGLAYAAGDAALLDGVPDHSVDVIVSMETIEHVPDWEAALRAFKRVLKPDGRLIASVPDRWMDETGEDPNPHHFHVFDWKKISDGIGQHFVLEAKYVQAAPGGFKLLDSPRILDKAPLEGDEGGEWLLAVAIGNPFDVDEARLAAYSHPAFSGRENLPVMANFAASYDNPYLYRSLIQMGERLTDDGKLIKLALMVAEGARADSPDRGGAITVLGYRALEARMTGAAQQVLGFIDAYRQASAGTNDPHTGRWRLSHAFLAGKLSELMGETAQAIAWYRLAQAEDWRTFSPLLATKTVGAAFFEGRLHLTLGDEAAARACFSLGMRTAFEAAASPPKDIVGDLDNPLPFGMQELAEVIDMGSQCATALANLPLWRRSPGQFWSQIDTRRFGLATWAKDMEQENTRLRARL